MIFNSHEIRGLLTGAVSFSEEDGWLTPRRFTEEQMRSFASDEGVLVRARASSGMTLDVLTDAEALSFDAKLFFGSSQRQYYFDVLVDGALRYHEGRENVAEDERSLRFPLPGKKARVTVIFPCLFGFSIRDLSFEGAKLVSTVRKSEKFLFVGDSITQGYTARFPSLTWTNLVCAARNAECVNQAIGGARFASSAPAPLPGFTPDRIFVAYGTNDWSGRLDVSASARTYLTRLREIWRDVPVTVILPIARLDAERREASGDAKPFAEMREELAAVCRDFAGVTPLDSLDYVPPFAPFFADGFLHPNEPGFMKYADAVLKALDAN